MKKILLIVLVALIFFFAYFLFDFFLFNLSYGNHPVNNIETLMINENDLPTGWKFDYIKPIKGEYDWGSENKTIAFVLEPEKGSITQYVYRFNNSFYASKYAYSSLMKDLIFIKENKNSFLFYKSPMANDWYLACDFNKSGGPMCEVLGRYEEYIVYLSITSDKNGITSDGFKKILLTIDDRMANILK